MRIQEFENLSSSSRKLKIRFSQIARLASDEAARGESDVRNRREHADVWIRLIEIESLYLL